MDHLNYMERCELDRLKAVKSGIPFSIDDIDNSAT